MPVWLVVVVLGILEGITEFIPISSTGHLLIAQKLLQLTGALGADHWLVAASAQKDLFNVVIQCGAVIAVLPLFPERLRQLAGARKDLVARDYLFKVVAAFFITGVGGLLMEKAGFRLPEAVLPVAMALLVGGILFVCLETWLKDRPGSPEISWSIVWAVGLAQLLAAALPGTSRSGSTILIALAMGVSRPAATEFTFLVGIPTMLSAGLLKIYKQLHLTGSAPTDYWTMVALGTIVSAVVSFLAVKWLLRYVQTHTFVAFGWYRIGLAIALLLLVLG